MNVAIIGAGYVGLSTAVGLAKLEYNTTLIDVDENKIVMINQKKSPIGEKDVNEILQKYVPKKLRATKSYQDGLEKAEVIFICVGTPSLSNGSINLTYIKDSLKEIGAFLKQAEGYPIVVVKSTVVPTTTDNIIIPILEKVSGKNVGKKFGVVVNPEFLREGHAVEDFLNPDRIVIGYKFEHDLEIMKKLYSKINAPIYTCSFKTAEMIKYASNAFLAMKISFINEIGNLCKLLKVDVYDVAKGVAMDHRIAPHFLNAGIGFGGSCFPKDVNALISLAEEQKYNSILLKSILAVNNNQPKRFIELVKNKIGCLKDQRITVLGLAFKPNVDDIRESPSIKIVKQLLQEKAIITVYDPQAMDNAKKILGTQVIYSDSAYDAISKSEIILITTEWDEFKNLDLYRNKIVFDGRRALNPIEAKKYCKYYEGICW